MIALLTGHSEEYAPLAQQTIYRNKADYCKLYGYELRIFRGVTDRFRNPQSHANGFTWARLAEMLSLVESGRYEWVYCVGCDTLITNFMIGLMDLIQLAGNPAPGLPLVRNDLPPGVPPPIVGHWTVPGYRTDGRTHVLFSCDRSSVVQADSFFVRGSELGAFYLRDILAQYPIYRTQPWVEQQAMADLRQKHAAITRIVPQCWMNSYDYALFQHLGRYYDGSDCYGNRGQWQSGDFLIHWPSQSLEKRLALARTYATMVIQ